MGNIRSLRPRPRPVHVQQHDLVDPDTLARRHPAAAPASPAPTITTLPCIIAPPSSARRLRDQDRQRRPATVTTILIFAEAASDGALRHLPCGIPTPSSSTWRCPGLPLDCLP
jgi:hypothetical protein